MYLDKDDGIATRVKPGALVIDSSTIDPQGSQQVALAVQEAGRARLMVDAPVSGGIIILSPLVSMLMRNWLI